MRFRFHPVSPCGRARRIGLRLGGFTLVELMVVLVLISILTAVMLPEMRGTHDDALLRATSRQLIDACQLAQNRAITLNRSHRLSLEPLARRFRIERQVRGDRRESTGFRPVPNLPGSQGSWSERISLRPVAQEPTEESQPPNDSENTDDPTTAVFYPDGSATAFALMLRDPAGFGLILRVNPTSGRVHLEPAPRA